MPKKITVAIAEDGKTFVETDGFKGPSCVKAITELFDAFVEVDHFDPKADYYEEEETISNTLEIHL